MANKYLANKLADDPAFERVFARLANRANQVSGRWMSVDPSEIADQKRLLKALLGQLKKTKTSVKSLKNRNLQKALGTLGISANTLASDVPPMVKDATRVLVAHPRLAIMSKKDKSDTIKNVIGRPKFKSALVPSIQKSDASASAHDRRCTAVLVLEIIVLIAAAILAIVFDIVVEAASAGIATPLVIAIVVCELVMFLLGIAISIVSFVDCRAS